MLYLKTRDIFYVKSWLDHSRIENTMKYIRVANAVSAEQINYLCKFAKDLQGATELIEAGFEYVA